jgi:hypothetical protein
MISAILQINGALKQCLMPWLNQVQEHDYNVILAYGSKALQ